MTRKHMLISSNARINTVFKTQEGKESKEEKKK
jgi:hypothetical protein